MGPLSTFQTTQPISEAVRTAQIALAAEQIRTHPKKEDLQLRRRPGGEPKRTRKTLLERQAIANKMRPRTNE